MQGPGTEKEARVSFILMIFIFVTLISAGLVSCAEQFNKEEKEYNKKRDSYFQYKEGDIVYIKPDSTIGVITDRTLWSEDKKEYRVRYSTKVGKLEYIDIYEPSIFSKK